MGSSKGCRADGLSPPSMARARLAVQYEAEEASVVALPSCLPLHTVARMPSPTDNCAVVTRTLDAGSILELPLARKRVRLTHTVLEGHRVAVVPIPNGELLTSWGQGFGRALVAIPAGESRACTRAFPNLSPCRRLRCQRHHDSCTDHEEGPVPFAHRAKRE
jgi:hypothetical protein